MECCGVPPRNILMRIPRATYRFQFTPDFGFEEARRIVPYLKELGISDIYASPIFSARKGSRHGYDVTDPNALNPELGAPETFSSLMETVHQHGMGWVQDIVPNHMAFDASNRHLMDVLQWGRGSDYHAAFDIDWDHPDPRLTGRLMVPFLGKPLRECIQEGEVKLAYGREGFSIRYGSLSLPLRMESYQRILDRIPADVGPLPGIPDSPAEGVLPAELLARLIAELFTLYQSSPSVQGAIDLAVAEVNAPEHVALEPLLADQHYHLTFWKDSSDTINYRRFFTIGELICVRVERGDVFDDTHRMLLELCRKGSFTGLRIDHIDGLFDPKSYLSRLRGEAGGVYLIVEKILNRKEHLPDWPIQGTTGYDFLNVLNGLFCDPAHAKHLQSVYTAFTGEENAPLKLLMSGKKKVIERYMSGDADNLTRRLAALARTDPASRPVRLARWRRTLVEAVAHFPVYRTYVDGSKIEKADEEYIHRAVDRAKKGNPDLAEELEFLRQVLMLEGPALPGGGGERLDFVMRFQQFTGPLMAKGFEDTALYIYHRLISLNEVGGYPEHFGTGQSEWHDYLQRMQGRWPHTMNATATHDTKRGEDLRARVNVLSEVPGDWQKKMDRWNRMNRWKKKEVRGRLAPGRNEEYLIYQTLLGAYPAAGDCGPDFIDRIQQYMIKAMREAKVHSGWMKPDETYEQVVLSFIESILLPGPENPFPEELRKFCYDITDYGILNALSQTMLKIASPGVPDFYQGTELWDLSLVDPDNRNEVDYETRIRLLDKIRRAAKNDLRALLRELWDGRRDGRIKMYLIYSALRVRRAHEALFRQGAYQPLAAEGVHKERVTTFARIWEGSWALAVAPRFFTRLAERGKIPAGRDTWGDTRIGVPPGAPVRWKDAITDREIAGGEDLFVGDTLAEFPVALLIGETR
jgi:(1->4)-alpha-D-glucan 1-alpha-D-glucosylmutase